MTKVSLLSSRKNAFFGLLYFFCSLFFFSLSLSLLSSLSVYLSLSFSLNTCCGFSPHHEAFSLSIFAVIIFQVFRLLANEGDVCPEAALKVATGRVTHLIHNAESRPERRGEFVCVLVCNKHHTTDISPAIILEFLYFYIKHLNMQILLIHQGHYI